MFFGASILEALLKKNISPPVLSGSTSNGGAYYLSATKMSNNIFNISQKEALVYITSPCFIYTKDKVLLVANSKNAIYNSTNSIVQFNNPINIVLNRVAKLIVESGVISIKNEVFTSDTPIMGTLDNHVLYARGLNMNNITGNTIIKGPVSVLTPKTLPTNLDTTKTDLTSVTAQLKGSSE